jgi:hypothetical protein
MLFIVNIVRNGFVKNIDCLKNTNAQNPNLQKDWAGIEWFINTKGSYFCYIKTNGENMHEIGEFKGNKIITLKRNPDDQYPFSFGKLKAKLIIENYEAIKKFAEE